ncbi:DUF262 domain-containing protein [Streptomyces sp. NPDC057909]|uniref:DUF262 domain-containing protein n=1 Tax=Streptomyces sp. NPDC057909 TaxID=3346277 RepID=UPI0036ECEA34
MYMELGSLVGGLGRAGVTSRFPSSIEVTMTFGAASVSPRSVGVGALLEEHHPFWVPRYQRSFAWATQTEAFIDDVKDLHDGAANERGHFFGGFVCIEHTKHTESRPHDYQIVDGQQRLTTFVLTLSEIAAEADRISAEARRIGDQHVAASADILAADTRDRFVYWNYSNVAQGKVERRPRLSLGRADNVVFQDILAGVLVNPTRESHELLVSAQETLKTKLIKTIVDAADTWIKKVEALDRLRRALTMQSHVIQIVCLDRERAYQLFSVLNDRGRSLADADLLRSHTLEILEGSGSEQEKAASIWDDILGTSSSKISDFFKAYYPSTTGVRAGAPLFKKLREAYFADGSIGGCSPEMVVEQVQRFSDEKDTYLRITSGAWPYVVAPTPGFGPAASGWEKDRLKRLVVTLKHELAVPLLMAAAQSAGEKRFAELVFMLEIFAFRYKNICGGHATPPGKIYYAEARRVREQHANGNPISWEGLRGQLQGLLSKVASDEHFKSSLENVLRYDRGSAQKANLREFLTTLEDHKGWLLSGANGRPRPDMISVFDLNQVTIEHIYPQNPLPGDSDPVLAGNVHRLGNLTFFGPGENSDAGNKSFVTKRDNYYKQSKVRLTSELEKLSQWTEVEYVKRLERIKSDACKVFRL